MALSKLGDFIELVDLRNNEGEYGVESLMGISINKVLTPTKADTSNLNVKTYKILKQNWFTYCTVTSRNGNKISLVYNDGKDCIVSSINPVFKIQDESKILPRYLMMFFNRSEFDRYARFNSWGSARETFGWDDLCNIELEIPSLEIQKKYVAIYEAMLANLRSYEKELENLKLICDCYIENIKNTYTAKRIGEFIKNESVKNVDNLNLDIVGISKEQKLISSDSKTKGVDKKKYYILEPYHFVFSPIHINEGSIAYNDSNNRYLISPIYKTFTILNTSNLDANYLSLWFSRNEFVRYCWFYAFGSARDTFDWQNLCDVIIPIPPLSVQKSISEIYKNYKMCKLQVEKIRQTLAVICPVLVRGSILESRGKDVTV